MVWGQVLDLDFSVVGEAFRDHLNKGAFGAPPWHGERPAQQQMPTGKLVTVHHQRGRQASRP